MKTAFVFPGQGTQKPGMAAEFYDEWDEMRACFERLDDAVDCSLFDLCFQSTANELRKPRNTQPAIVAAGLATYAGFKRRFDIDPVAVSGHSLGQFTAGACADLILPTEVVGLVRKRGELMEEVTRSGESGKMVAILSGQPDIVSDVCAAYDGVEIALYNTPRQTVISGLEEDVESACEDLRNKCSVRCRELDVGAAFHSSVMESAAESISSVIQTTEFFETDTPVVSDVSARPYTTPAAAKRTLTTQLTATVDWISTVETLRKMGVKRYVEFPPAGTLSRFIDRIHPKAETVPLTTPADARAVFTAPSR